MDIHIAGDVNANRDYIRLITEIREEERSITRK